MTRSSRIVPDEWVTALHTFVVMRRSGMALHRAWSNVLGFSFPFAVGAWVGLWGVPELYGVESSVLVGVAAGVLAYCAILIGFGVTLMLFTGRVDRPEEMPLEVLRAYAGRIRYLLASQGLTLFLALATTVATLVWTLVVAAGGSFTAILWVGAFVSGLTAVCLARTALLPLQIFELHETWLSDALAAKEEALAKRYARRPINKIDDLN